MSKRHASIQFFKDGLIGVVLTGLFYILTTLLRFFPGHIFKSIFGDEEGLNILFHFFLGLLMFTCAGINGQLIENVTTRQSWKKPILQILISTWVWFIFFEYFGSLTLIMFDNMFQDNFSHGIYQTIAVFGNIFLQSINAYIDHPLGLFFGVVIYGGIFGMAMVFAITYLAATVFNPQKRLSKLLFSMGTSIFTILSMLAGLFVAVVFFPGY